MAGVILRIALIVVAVAAALLPLDPLIVERWYSTSVYARLQRVLTPVSNALPVAWLDVVSIAALAGLCWVWWRALRAAGEPVWRRLTRGALTTATIVLVAYLAFLGLWGLNYRRLPMPHRLALQEQPP